MLCSFQALRALALAAAATTAVVAGCESAKAPESASPSAAVEPKQVRVVAAQLQSWPDTVRVQGSLLADEDSIVGSKLAGRVETVKVDLGSVVKQGDELVLLDRREFELQVKLAESQLQQACAAIALTPDEDETKIQFENAAPVRLERAQIEQAQAALARAEPLLPSRAVTAAEYDVMVSQLKAAQARHDSALNGVSEQVALIGVRRTELALARQQLADASILAPFDGVVEQRRVAPGEYVQVGQPVVTLVRSDRLRYTAGVPETRAAAIRLGQPIEIHLPHASEPVVAAVSRISPTVTPTSRSILIEADVPNTEARLQAGLFAEADVVVNAEAQSLTLPSTAVSRFAGVQKVWLVEKGAARQLTVQTGREAGGRIELTGGLKTGDVVVTNAAEGYEGPIVAVDAPAEPQQATIPVTSAAAD
jgi:RND family efflux transporter MFP subunit